MADAVVSVLVEKLLRLLLGGGLELLQLDDQFDKMKNELRFVKTWLEDAETLRRKDGRKILKLITQDLRELVYDAEDIIADCQIFFMEEKHNGSLSNFMKYLSPRLLKFRYEITKRLKETNQAIDKVKESMGSYLASMSPAPITSIGESSKSRPLSYEELPPYLKPCLICFSMLPEDYSIEVVDIVHWWIGEGFVLGSEGRTAFEIGKERVSELVNRCVLIGGEKDELSGELCSVKIHDKVRDMIIKIARDENFTHLDKRGRPKLTVQSRRMGMFSNGIIKSIERTELKKSTIESKLRTLWAFDIGKEDVLSNNMELRKLKRLRVLSVSFNEYSKDEGFLKDWLDGIASLLHLVSLKIENCGLQNLPDSVGNLHNLQILCLSKWYNLKMLPSTITKLDKLTSFDIESCYLLECMPDGIERLSRLERLTGFRPTISSHTSQILHLKDLSQLRELSIYLKNPNNLVEEELNVLSKLQNLRYLNIDFYHADADAAALASKVNHQLSPLRNVRELFLSLYAGESTPIWLNAKTFPNLQFLGLFGGDNIKHMDPGFWEKKHGVWKIEGIFLLRLLNFKEKRKRFHDALPYLKTLSLRDMPEN